MSRAQQSGELEAYSDDDRRGDKATRRSVSARVIMRGEHCLKVWTKKQHKWCHCSPLRASCTPHLKTASEGLGSRAWQRTWGISCGLNLHLDASATMCLVNRRGLGKAKHVDVQSLCIRETSKSGLVGHEEGGHEREPTQLDDETDAEIEDRAAHEHHAWVTSS